MADQIKFSTAFETRVLAGPAGTSKFRVLATAPRKSSNRADHIRHELDTRTAIRNWIFETTSLCLF